MSSIQPPTGPSIRVVSPGDGKSARVDPAPPAWQMAADERVAGPAPSAVWTARLGSDDPAGEIDRACALVQAARSRAEAAPALAIMKRELAGMKAEKSPLATPYGVKVAAALAHSLTLPARATARGGGKPAGAATHDLAGLPTSTITRLPASPVDGPTPGSAARARQLLAGYAHEAGGVATPAFEQLAVADQTVFLRVLGECDSTGQVALHGLLEQGRLSPPLLGALGRLATAALAPGIERGALLSQTLDELADPSCIAQRDRGTCAVTCIQMLVALREPAVYVKLVEGLASEAGRAGLAGGLVLQRAADWDCASDGGRSLPSRLLQPALMELGNGPASYDNTRDLDIDPVTQLAQPSGLDSVEAAKLLGTVMEGAPTYDLAGPSYQAALLPVVVAGIDASFHSPQDLLRVLQDPKLMDVASQDRLVTQIAAYATPHDPVYCNVIYTLQPATGGVGYHAVLATGVTKGRVTFINPAGREESMSVDQFKRSLMSIGLRHGDQPPKP